MNFGSVRISRDSETSTLRQGLVGAWCPSISGSGNLLPDLSGGGNHGALTNMGPEDWVSAQYGRALDFDGSNDYVSFSNLTSSPITFSAYCLRTASWNFNGSCLIWAKENGNYQSNGFYIELGSPSVSGKLFLQTNGTNNTAASDAQVSTLFALNTWTSFVFTLNNGVVKFFINGNVISSSQTNTPNITSLNAAKYIFYNSPSYNNATPSQIDDIRIYNRALSESEIKLLANRPGIGLQPQPPRQSFYQFPASSRRKRILTGMP